MKRAVCLALLLGSVTATAAAQNIVFDDFEWVTYATSGGCIAYESQMNDMEPEAPKATMTWSGVCKAGELINGKGTLTFKRVGRYYQNTRKYTGTLVGGYLDGKITIADTYASVTDKADKGASPVATLPFKMGCLILSDGNMASGMVGDRHLRCRPKTVG